MKQKVKRMQSLLPAVIAAAILLVNADTWAAGAIAAGPDGAWGTANSYSRVEDAEEDAIDECGNDECKIVVNYKSGCAAYALDSTRYSTVWGAARGDDKITAQNNAVYQCQRSRGQRCQVRASVCDKK